MYCLMFCVFFMSVLIDVFCCCVFCFVVCVCLGWVLCVIFVCGCVVSVFGDVCGEVWC